MPEFPLPLTVDTAYAARLQALRADADDIADISRAVNDLVLETISALPDQSEGDDDSDTEQDENEDDELVSQDTAYIDRSNVTL